MKAIATLIEKVLWTYVQAVLTLVLAGGALAAGGLSRSLAVAALPAALTVLANGLPAVPQGLPFYVDLFFRIVRTAAVSFIGFLVAQPVFDVNANVARAAGLSALMAALVVIKGAAARQFGAESAATLPSDLDPVQPTLYDSEKMQLVA